jgi:DNA-binding NarL/FixJ family response regulator
MICDEAATGREALAKALELQPDVLVLDVGLPETNGLEVTRQVRRAMPVAVLIVTHRDSDQVVHEAIAAGASGYVLKADAGRTLAEAVRTVLSQRQFFSERVRAATGLESSPGQTEAGRLRTERLTSPEREVFQLPAEGQGNKAVLSALGITTKTAETHRARIMARWRSIQSLSLCVTQSATASSSPRSDRMRRGLSEDSSTTQKRTKQIRWNPTEFTVLFGCVPFDIN